MPKRPREETPVVEERLVVHLFIFLSFWYKKENISKSLRLSTIDCYWRKGERYFKIEIEIDFVWIPGGGWVLNFKFVFLLTFLLLNCNNQYRNKFQNFQLFHLKKGKGLKNKFEIIHISNVAHVLGRWVGFYCFLFTSSSVQ